MQTGKTPVILSAVIICLILTCLPAIAADGMVAGTVSLEMEDGHAQPGNWIRILLVTRPVAVPKLEPAMRPDNPGYIEAVNLLHSGFYIQVQNRLAEAGYLYASTLTTDEGTFKIPAISPGDYFVLVKFPANIRGYKVAWQVPVRVKSGETATIDLNRSNLALPAVKR
jgi:hypothetical protein